MLSFFDDNGRGTGGKTTRRDFLRVGSLGLGGLSLSQMLATNALAAQRNVLKDKSVVFLFMHGGPAQTETFDPKMEAPSGVRSMTGEIPTTIPGITFGGTFKKLSRLAHKFNIVRSFATGNGNHDIKPVMSKYTKGANMGSIYSHVAGTANPLNGMPTNVSLFPRAVDPNTQVRNSSFGKFIATGELGKSYAPFIPGTGGKFQENMKLKLSRSRLDDRRSLLTSLDQIKRAADAKGAMEGIDKFNQQAFDTILGGVANAFDLSQEDPATLALYDTAPLVRPASIRKVWNNHKNYADHGQSLGKLMLLARRLCEAGSGFVTVTTNFVWDMHADKNNATMEEGMHYVGEPFDHAVSAFIEDIEARGLRDKILLVCCGEMGRSPKVNKKGGRDHWGGLAPLMLYGGGLPQGRVIGQSTRDAGEPLSDAVGIPDLISTIMHSLIDVGQLRIQPNLSREIMSVVDQGKPIKGLL
jgi:uncharacterized protein (DUF1501 family)